MNFGSSNHGVPLPNLRAWRIYSGFSRDELASMAGVTANTLNRIENTGRTVRFQTIGHLAKALGISRKELMHQLPSHQLEQVGA